MVESTNSPRLNNFPVPLSTFIGREHEISAIKQLLLYNRLVTLTGVGGSGKTRLAIQMINELLNQFEQGAWFIEFAPLDDDSLLAQAVASTLGVREKKNQPLIDEVIDHIQRHHSLLIFDNCEHLIDACAKLAEKLLQACQNLQILATSREPLGISGEAVWTVPPLSLPELYPWRDPSSGEIALPAYQQSEAVQLFLNRAVLVSPNFALTKDNGAWIAEICRRLDGLPLAIELAAARVRALSLQQIAERLNDRFSLLTGGHRTAPARQQTLEATLDWSYALLSITERKVLQNLSVFSGGGTLDAVEYVCTGNGVEAGEVLDILTHLVEKSLTVATQKSDKMRYSLLETIRQYAGEKLIVSGSVDETKDRHLKYFMEWAENAETHLDTSDQLLWLERYKAEHDNLRAALRWSQSKKERGETGLKLAAACGRYWRLHGHFNEGRTHLSLVLSLAGAKKRSATRAKALFRAGVLAYLQSDYPASESLLEESLSISQELGQAGKLHAANALEMLGEVATERGDYETAMAFFEEAMPIYKHLNDKHGLGEMLMQFSWAYMRMGNYENAAEYLEEFLTVAIEANYTTHIAFALGGLGELAIRQGKYERASKLLEESLGLHRQTGDKWDIATSLGSLGWLALRQGNLANTKNLLDESLKIRREIDDRGGIAWCLEKLGKTAFLEKQPKKAAIIFGAASALRTTTESVIDPADQPEYKRIISGLQSALGLDTFNSAWTRGESTPLEDMIQYALSEPEKEPEEEQSSTKDRFGGLSNRERETAALIAQGKSNRDIAEIMTVRKKTVETYVTRILNKLGFKSRVEVATWAIETGLKDAEFDRE